MNKNVIIVENDESWRFLFKHLLGNFNSVTVVGEFDNAEEALASLSQMQPDLVIADYSLPGINGFELIRRLREISDAKVLVVTSHKREFFRSAQLSSQAINLVEKGDNDKFLKKTKELLMN